MPSTPHYVGWAMRTARNLAQAGKFVDTDGITYFVERRHIGKYAEVPRHPRTSQAAASCGRTARWHGAHFLCLRLLLLFFFCLGLLREVSPERCHIEQVCAVRWQIGRASCRERV